MTTAFPEKLLEGYKNFMSGRFTEHKEAYYELAEKGQKPETMVIGCCDSRATPEAIFNTAPGEFFVTRNIANLVPPYTPDGATRATSAALEYAVQVLKVKNILVMGHARCGGIQASLATDMEPLSPGDFVGSWIDLVRPTAAAVKADSTVAPGDRQTELERRSIIASIENLRTFPCVSILEDKGKINLLGAWFDIANGDLRILDSKSGNFVQPSTD